jgi:hypothetical protein
MMTTWKITNKGQVGVLVLIPPVKTRLGTTLIAYETALIREVLSLRAVS